MKPVPEHYLGVWQRTLLRTTSGVEDTSTAVYWLQTEHFFADLRIPQNTRNTPESRALQAGFAGVTEVTGERCQWHRAIDFQPPSEREDIGLMDFTGTDALREDGVDGSYYELWQRLPDSLGRNQGIWLQDEAGRQGCLLLAGDYFLFAASRAQPLTHADSLSALLAAGAGEAILDFELSFGRHHHGRSPWLIEQSTLPERAGQRLLPESIEPDQSLAELSPEAFAQLGALPPSTPWHLCAWPQLPGEAYP